MLVLSRRDQEDVVIRLPDGRLIVVHVAAIERGRVRLGFTADKDIEFYRWENMPDERRAVK